MRLLSLALVLFALAALVFTASAPGQEKKKEEKFLDPIDTKVPAISTDESVKYDYDIVYVRAKRAGDKVHKRFFTDFSSPVTIEPGADLVLLHPDGDRGAGSVHHRETPERAPDAVQQGAR
jgi:hypothetical protein